MNRFLGSEMRPYRRIANTYIVINIATMECALWLRGHARSATFQVSCGLF